MHGGGLHFSAVTRLRLGTLHSRKKYRKLTQIFLGNVSKKTCKNVFTLPKDFFGGFVIICTYCFRWLPSRAITVAIRPPRGRLNWNSRVRPSAWRHCVQPGRRQEDRYV